MAGYISFKISPDKLRAMPTDKLEWIIGIGRAGLSMWKPGRQLDEMKRHMVTLEAELAQRKQERR